MKIKEVLTAHVITYHDFEAFAEMHYGHDPEIVASEEWSNDTQHLYKGVTAEDKSKWTKLDIESWNDFLAVGTSSYGITRSILEDLVADGILEPGNYIIDVSW